MFNEDGQRRLFHRCFTIDSVKEHRPAYTIVIAGLPELAQLTVRKLGVIHYVPDLTGLGTSSARKVHDPIFIRAEEMNSHSTVVHPCLRPNAIFLIETIEAFSGVIAAGSAPTLLNDTGVKHDLHLAVTRHHSVLSVHYPLSNPKVKLSESLTGTRLLSKASKRRKNKQEQGQFFHALNVGN